MRTIDRGAGKICEDVMDREVKSAGSNQYLL